MSRKNYHHTISERGADGLEARAIDLAHYIVEHNATVRKAAGIFGVSKSTVHKDVTERLQHISPGLAGEVRKVLQKNKEERHLRGGEATRVKYLK